jgi:hypothetical protein
MSITSAYLSNAGLLSTREAQESSRHRSSLAEIKRLQRCAIFENNSGKKSLILLTASNLAEEDREAQERYARDRQHCKEAWTEWQAWVATNPSPVRR